MKWKIVFNCKTANKGYTALNQRNTKTSSTRHKVIFSPQRIKESRRRWLTRLIGLVIAEPLCENPVRGRAPLDQVIFNDIHHDRRAAHHKDPFTELVL